MLSLLRVPIRSLRLTILSFVVVSVTNVSFGRGSRMMTTALSLFVNDNNHNTYNTINNLDNNNNNNNNNNPTNFVSEESNPHNTIGSSNPTRTTTTTNDNDPYPTIPPLNSSYGSYPNPLRIIVDDGTERQELFHPVIHIPTNSKHYIVSDYSPLSNDATDAVRYNVATEQQRYVTRTNNWIYKSIRHIKLGIVPRLSYTISSFFDEHILSKIQQQQQQQNNNNNATTNYEKVHYLKKQQYTKSLSVSGQQPYYYYYCYYGIGRYDENRVTLYRTSLFDNIDNTIDGYTGQRTVHVGIDFNGPLGTPVYSIMDGILHSAGYNPEHGDYGYVIIIQYILPPNNSSRNEPITFYALYGHLDEITTRKYRIAYDCMISNKSNEPYTIKKGEMIGRLGDIYENGGWIIPHVHFQVSIKKPQTHDMPGAITVEDRETGLWDYPDPRYIVGELY